MGGWLARLKNQNTPDTPATKPTKLLQVEGAAGFVGFVAYPAASLRKIGAGDLAAVKPKPQVTSEGPPSAIAPANVADQWRWPNSVAWNSRGIEILMSRLVRFTDMGLSWDDAYRLTSKWV